MAASMRFYFALFIAGTLASLSISSPSVAEESLKISGKTMGSYYSIVIDSPGDAKADDLRKEIECKFDDINRQMSTWADDSEISRFNASTSMDWFPVSRDFAIVATEALRVHELTDGVLDVTVAPLIDLWGFGKKKAIKVPSDQQVEEALKSVGSKQLEVRMDPPAVRKLIPSLQISFSALAPGYAADEISAILRSRGLKSHVVDVGGENLAGEAKSSGDAWRLGVESPLGGLQQVVEVTHKAVATSGDYRSFFVADGKRYSHVLNPTTGRPVDNPPASVSVIHRSCMTADAVATAMMVLGAEKGMKIAERMDVDVMFQDVDSDGKLTVTARGLFRQPE
jgi:thiamine biosynthesis lipoprotein